MSDHPNPENPGEPPAKRQKRVSHTITFAFACVCVCVYVCVCVCVCVCFRMLVHMYMFCSWSLEHQICFRFNFILSKPDLPWGLGWG